MYCLIGVINNFVSPLTISASGNLLKLSPSLYLKFCTKIDAFFVSFWRVLKMLNMSVEV